MYYVKAVGSTAVICAITSIIIGIQTVIDIENEKSKQYALNLEMVTNMTRAFERTEVVKGQFNDLNPVIEKIFNETVSELWVALEKHTQITFSNAERHEKINARITHNCRQIIGLYEQTYSATYELTVGEEIIYAFCDMETDGGGWTVIQRRQSGNIHFYRNFFDYENGFGLASQGADYWMGLKKVYEILKTSASFSLRVDIQDFELNNTYAMYSTFSLGHPSTDYNLTVGGYSGTAGDSLSAHNGQKFSTYDRDNDNNVRSCAFDFQGAWWYDDCGDSNLNGPFNDKPGQNTWGIFWRTLKNGFYSLKRVEMKIRPN